jgi:hypothetical protein
VAKVDDGRRAFELHAQSRASLEEKPDGVVLFERRHRVDVLTLELQPLAARDEDGGPGDLAQRRELLGKTRQQVLGVVEDEEGLPPGERRPQSVL